LLIYVQLFGCTQTGQTKGQQGRKKTTLNSIPLRFKEIKLHSP